MAEDWKWITCRNCQGDEGEIVNDRWIDCQCCQGEGGHPEGKTWSCTCEPEED